MYQKSGLNKFRYCPLVEESAVTCQMPLKTVDEIDSENGRTSNFQCHMTLTLDRAIWHTVVHHSLTSTYIPNFVGIKVTFCGCTDVCMDVHTDGRTDIEAGFIRSTQSSGPSNAKLHHKLCFIPRT